MCVCVCVCAGERLEVEVVTDLSPEGDFWGQLLLPREAESYDRLQEELQAAKRRAEDEAFTPVFYHEGELCIARFSEDGNWYRARIERLRPGAVRNRDTHTLTFDSDYPPPPASHVVHSEICGLWKF